jgi:hypothetical protein
MSIHPETIQKKWLRFSRLARNFTFFPLLGRVAQAKFTQAFVFAYYHTLSGFCVASGQGKEE